MDIKRKLRTPENIVSLNKKCQDTIGSGQVIANLVNVIKELIENAIDAKSTNTEIRLHENGYDLIEVCDNGYGISDFNLNRIMKMHHTSKLKEFSDLEEIETYGFRGEALSSICSMSQLKIITKTDDEVIGKCVEFNTQGEIIKRENRARARGTTLSIKNIFSTLPVRRQKLKQSLKNEYMKVIKLMQSYGIISIGTRILCTNCTKRNHQIVLQTDGESMIENINNIYGSKIKNSLTEVSIDLNDSQRIIGYVSKSVKDTSKIGADIKFYYINDRPIDMVKLTRMINETFRSCNEGQFNNNNNNSPSAIINFKLNNRSIDINLTPDKRTIFIKDESTILNILKDYLIKLWQIDDSKLILTPNQQKSNIINYCSSNSNSSLKKRRLSNEVIKIDENKPMEIEPSPKKIQLNKTEEKDVITKNEIELKDDEIDTLNTSEESLDEFLIRKNEESYLSALETPVKSMGIEIEETEMMNFDISDLELRIKLHKEKELNEDLIQEETMDDNDEGNRALYFNKKNFSESKVIGQFNQGFIIIKHHDKLYIVDQHAADEKHTYEKLLKNKNKNTQPLVISKPLELTYIQKSIIKENLDIFKKNGFQIEENDENMVVTAFPMIKNIVFDISDIYELISLIEQVNENGTIFNDMNYPIPSKIRNIMAMKACRYSVMIGKSLDMEVMKRIVKNLGCLDRPWNCPHGRPTISFLKSIEMNNSSFLI